MKEIRKAKMPGNNKFLRVIGNSIRKDAFNKNKRKNLKIKGAKMGSSLLLAVS